MPRRCIDWHAEPRPGECRLCELFETDDRYRALWGGPAARRAAPCRHLGAPTGETALCPTCPNSSQGHEVPLLACAVHGTTTGRRFATGRKTCHGCADRAAG